MAKHKRYDDEIDSPGEENKKRHKHKKHKHKEKDRERKRYYLSTYICVILRNLEYFILF